MSDLLTNLSALFSFLFTQMTNLASFFTSNTLGLLILGLSVFGLIFGFVVKLVNDRK